MSQPVVTIERHILDDSHDQGHRGDGGKEAAEHAAEPVEEHVDERPHGHLVVLALRFKPVSEGWSDNE